MTRLVVLRFGTAIVMLLPPAAHLFAQGSGRPNTTPGAPRAPIERPVPFKVGETLTYDVSWSTFLVAGTAVLTVQDKKPALDSTAYYIVAEGRPVPFVARLYPLYYKMDTLLDARTLLPQRASTYSEEGSDHKSRTTVFDRAGKKAQFESRTATIVKTEFPISPVVLDALSAVYVLRSVPVKAGDRRTMPVSDDGSNYELQVEAFGPERVKTGLGDASAWRLGLTITDAQHQQVGRNMSVWISDDARRLPVKMQADLGMGNFVLALREVR